MKKTLVVIVAVILFVGFTGCGKVNKLQQNTETGGKTQIKLPCISLPQGCFTPKNLDIELRADTSGIPKTMRVYKIVPQKIDSKIVEELCEVFGISTLSSVVKKKDFTEIKQGEKELIVYDNTGYYEFVATRNLYDYFPGKVVPPKKECIKIAKSFLEKNNLLPKMYRYHAVICSSTIYHPASEKPIVTDITVALRPVIDATEIMGPAITVAIGDKGKIEQVDNHLYGITPIKNPYPLKTMKEIVKVLKIDKSLQWSFEPDVPGARKIIINKISVMYYGDIGTSMNLGQLFVQPVYRISGKAIFKDGKEGKFRVNVPAVDNKYIEPGC